MIIRFLSLVSLISSRSSFVRLSAAFNTSKTRSDCSMAFFERSTPIFSTLSSVSLMPAVSISFNGTPDTLTYSSITSRVVPATSVTIALSSCKRWFKRLDLPTFGRPTSAVANPSRMIFPCEAVLSSCSMRCLISIAFSLSSFVVISSTSSYSG